MALAPHNEIAQDIVDHLVANWSSKPAGATVSRARSFEAAIKDIEAGTGGRVVVVVPRTTGEVGSRGSDQITVPVYICVIASVPGLVDADLDAWELRADDIGTALRHRALKRLSVKSDTVVATRQGTVSVDTTADADMLYGSEVFFAVLSMRYTYSLEVPA